MTPAHRGTGAGVVRHEWGTVGELCRLHRSHLLLRRVRPACQYNAEHAALYVATLLHLDHDTIKLDIRWRVPYAVLLAPLAPDGDPFRATPQRCSVAPRRLQAASRRTRIRHGRQFAARSG